MDQTNNVVDSKPGKYPLWKREGEEEEEEGEKINEKEEVEEVEEEKECMWCIETRLVVVTQS